MTPAKAKTHGLASGHSAGASPRLVNESLTNQLSSPSGDRAPYGQRIDRLRRYSAGISSRRHESASARLLVGGAKHGDCRGVIRRRDAASRRKCSGWHRPEARRYRRARERHRAGGTGRYAPGLLPRYPDTSRLLYCQHFTEDDREQPKGSTKEPVGPVLSAPVRQDVNRSTSMMASTKRSGASWGRS